MAPLGQKGVGRLGFRNAVALGWVSAPRLLGRRKFPIHHNTSLPKAAKSLKIKWKCQEPSRELHAEKPASQRVLFFYWH